MGASAGGSYNGINNYPGYNTLNCTGGTAGNNFGVGGGGGNAATANGDYCQAAGGGAGGGGSFSLTGFSNCFINSVT